MVICLELGADLHTVQLMPLPLTVSCSSKIQIDLRFPDCAEFTVAEGIQTRHTCAITTTATITTVAITTNHSLHYCWEELLLGHTWTCLWLTFSTSFARGQR